jgi:hypothetical protein
MSKSETPSLIGEKSPKHWNTEWLSIPTWMDSDTYDLHGQAGLIRFWKDGQVVAYSSATELPAGLRKRLADFRRPSPSGRKHYAGEKIYENLDRLEVEVLITGERHAPEIGRKLRMPMIRLHKPAWTRFRVR